MLQVSPPLPAERGFADCNHNISTVLRCAALQELAAFRTVVVIGPDLTSAMPSPTKLILMTFILIGRATQIPREWNDRGRRSFSSAVL